MFGLLRPRTNQLSRAERTEYQSAYCNLCGSIASRYGVSARLLVLYDFASLAWLLGQDVKDSVPFPRYNCVRGGLRSARGALRDQDRFLAAASVYTCGIKVQDDLQDEQSARSRLAERYYRSSFRQARDDLERSGFDISGIDAVLAQQRDIERRYESRFDVASQPTGTAYALVAEHLVRLSSVPISAETAARLGDCLGRCVYLVDAYRDCAADVGVSHNPLCCADGRPAPEVPQARKRDLIRYVLAIAHEIDQSLEQQPAMVELRWATLRDRLLRLLDVETPSVTLNMTCCIPCGDDCVVAVDDNDCAGLCWGCCCLGCCCYNCLC